MHCSDLPVHPQTPLRQRARSDTHKQRRRASLIEAATQAFLTQRYESVTMLSVAQACGVSKASAFFYFPTKESLFLAMAEREIHEFFEALVQDLAHGDAPGGAAGVVAALDRAYARSPALVRLLGVLHGVLESRLEPNQARAFRQRLIPGIARAGRALERHLPFVTRGGGTSVVLSIHCIALGAQQLAEVAPARSVPGGSAGDVWWGQAFQTVFRPIVAAYLQGLPTTGTSLPTHDARAPR